MRSLLKHVYALDDSELGCTGIVQHSIDTDSHRSVKQQPYRTPIVQRDSIKRIVEQMQKQGIIQPSQSAWASAGPQEGR